MHPERTPAIADHGGAIPREAQRRDTAQAVVRETRQELVGRAGRERELELFLRYRFTHWAAPGSNPCPFHTSVCTSTVSRVIVQTFTDCGRCPRERLDTVPATEMNMRPSATIAS